MDLKTLVEEMTATNAPSRQWDVAIAFHLGWRKVSDGVWIDPAGENAKRPPFFTYNLQDAFDFANIAVPNCVGAVRWINKEFLAQVEEYGPPAAAESPALALCLATLRTILAARSPVSKFSEPE